MPSLIVVPGAVLPMIFESSRASLIGAPSIDVMTSPGAIPAFRGTVRLRLGDQRAARRLLQAETVGELRRHRLGLHTKPAARHRSFVAKLGHHGFHCVGGDCESDPDRAARRREDHGVDADDSALQVEARTAGVALVDRRIDLDQMIVCLGADVALARRHDAGRHRAAEPERIPDGKHPVADAGRPVG
jgi:hypothetical protein